MAAIDKAKLLAGPTLDEDDVWIHNGKDSVRVRALTRLEAGKVQKQSDTDAKDRLTLRFGMLDPQLTESEAGDWMKVDKAGDLVKVCTRIAQLSGLLESSETDAYKSDGREPGPGV